MSAIIVEGLNENIHTWQALYVIYGISIIMRPDQTLSAASVFCALSPVCYVRKDTLQTSNFFGVLFAVEVGKGCTKCRRSACMYGCFCMYGGRPTSPHAWS